jgi:hypothetical protein
MLTRKLVSEISNQLLGDILSYDWLLKITQEQLVGKTFGERADALIDALEILMIELKVTIGPAQLIDGKVQIQNWGHSVEQTICQLREFIDKHGEPGPNHEVAYGFWVGLPAPSNERNRVSLPVAGHPPHTT